MHSYRATAGNATQGIAKAFLAVKRMHWHKTK